MKANKAPEKIYIPRLEGNETFVHEWSATKFRKYYSREIAENVEYVRTDAFMKKAENFLEMLGYGFTITDNITHANYDKEQLIEDFRKYMEGE